MGDGLSITETICEGRRVGTVRTSSSFNALLTRASEDARPFVEEWTT
jgi:hypothetical protein